MVKASNNNRDRYNINEDELKNNSDFVKKEL
jgi:hypothetical protein